MFDFQLPTRIVFGSGRIVELGELARERSMKRVFVVSDQGIMAAGHTERALESLSTAGIEQTLFDGVEENPTTQHVDAGLLLAKEFQPDGILAIGGGSSMDCAKGINFLFSCGGRMQDYWGIGKATGPLLPMIAVPTTAGTGSETQSFALISDAKTHVKMACGDRRAAFKIALLDPELTRTMPDRVTALTGFDAIAHAIETFVTRPRNAMSIAFSKAAWQHLAPNFLRVLEDPNDLEARTAMQLGAMFAGLAIENSMLGAAHALANPLTANYGITHGEAVALMLPHVLRFNESVVGNRYSELSSTVHFARKQATLVEVVEHFCNCAGFESTLSSHKIPKSDVPKLAKEAATQWTAQFNPKATDEAAMLTLYEAAF